MELLTHSRHFTPVSYTHLQLGDPGGHGPLVLPDLPFVKEVLGQKLHRGGGGVDPAGEAGDIEDLRVVQAELEQDLPQRLHLQPGCLLYTSGILLMLLYSIGHSALVMVAGTSVGFVQRISGNTRYNKAETVLKVIMGTAILLIGFYMFWLAF